jgi:hypothetical protein
LVDPLNAGQDIHAKRAREAILDCEENPLKMMANFGVREFVGYRMREQMRNSTPKNAWFPQRYVLKCKGQPFTNRQPPGKLATVQGVEERAQEALGLLGVHQCMDDCIYSSPPSCLPTIAKGQSNSMWDNPLGLSPWYSRRPHSRSLGCRADNEGECNVGEIRRLK